MTKNYFISACGAIVLMISVSTWAAPTPKEIELFKSLPKNQQEQLLKEQGVSPQVLNKQSKTTQNPEPVVTTIQPIQQVPAPKVEKTSAPVEQKKPSLKRFGASLFSGNPTTFAPVNDIPVPTDYILGPGDQLNIQLYGNKNENYQLVLDRNGYLSVPEIGPISVAGQTLSEAKSNLIKQIANLGIGVHANVTLGELRSFRIFVLGESKTPGSYLVSGMATITHALYVSGGISEIGSFRNIQLKRNGKLIATLDLYNLLLKGNTKNDVRLQPGDSVFIPVSGQSVAIDGEVMRPAIYELKNEKTFSDILKLSGGTKPGAYLKETKVTRIRKDGFNTVKSLNLTRQKDLKQRIKNGDFIQIAGLIDQLENVVTLTGDIHRPGTIPWQKGLTLGQLLPNINAFKRNADLDFITILRQSENGGEYKVLETSWKKIQNKESPDVMLKASDHIYVFSKFSPEKRKQTLAEVTTFLYKQASLEKAPLVFEVSGHIKYPGLYPLAEKTTLYDAIQMTGGFLPNADINYILIKSEDNKTGQISFSQKGIKTAKNFYLSPKDKVFIFQNDQIDRASILAPSINQLKAQASLQAAPKVINISGHIKYPGEYPLPKNAPLTSIINIAGGFLPNADTQYILIKSENNQTGKIRFTQTTSELADTYQLNPKDQITIFKNDQYNRSETLATDIAKLTSQATPSSPAPLVIVNGIVKAPGVYPLTAPGRISDLINAAGGLKYQALLVDADVIRYKIVEGKKQEVETISLNLKKALEGNEQHNIKLLPFDEIIVKQVSEWSNASRKVSIEGEVLYPGTYTIKPGETLLDALARAGGFTEWAEPKNAVFLRKELKLQEARERQMLADEMEKNLLLTMKRDAGLYEGGGDQVTGILTMGQTLIERIRKTPALGRLIISLDDQNTSRFDATLQMELRDGDRLIVPKRSNEVLVTGEVSRSASIIYEEGKEIDDYISIGGGLTKRADQDSIYVVHGDGSIEKYSNDSWFGSDNNIAIRPGDTVVVPADVDSISPYITWTSVSKILANFAVTAATLKTIGVIN